MSKMTVNVKRFTLVLLREKDRVLLGYKKRGFGQGKWNGFGGKVEAEESITQAAHRELLEESGMRCSDLKQLGLMHFDFEGQSTTMEVHIFVGRTFTGTPTESQEMRPQWFDLCDVPYDKMWLDDEVWWPPFLDDKFFYGWCLYRGTEMILDSKLETVDSLKNVLNKML